MKAGILSMNREGGARLSSARREGDADTTPRHAGLLYSRICQFREEFFCEGRRRVTWSRVSTTETRYTQRLGLVCLLCVYRVSVVICYSALGCGSVRLGNIRVRAVSTRTHNERGGGDCGTARQWRAGRQSPAPPHQPDRMGQRLLHTYGLRFRRTGLA